MLRYRRLRPQSGWRKGVYAMTGGKINLGLSRADRRRADLIDAARTPVGGCYRLAVISLKGGVGKTTTTAALGAMFADLRGDRVIALDANPDRGTLGERAPRESGATVRHLLAARDRLHRYADVRHFTSQSPTRLEVLASDSDPSVSLAFSEQDYRDTVSHPGALLQPGAHRLRHRPAARRDARHPRAGQLAGRGQLGQPRRCPQRQRDPGLARGARLRRPRQGRGRRHLLGAPAGGIVDVMQLEDHFASRCRDVVTIPYDPHLESGGVLDLAELEPDTLDAYRELAAAVAEGSPRPAADRSGARRRGASVSADSSASTARRSSSSRS